METRIRIAGIIIQNEKILMLLGKGYPELWTPGGKTDGEENDEECLARELKEELGVELIEAKFFKEYAGKNFYNPLKTKIERVYIAKIEGEPKPDAEIERIVWFSKEDFENKKFPMITMTEEEIFPDIIKAGLW